MNFPAHWTHAGPAITLAALAFASVQALAGTATLGIGDGRDVLRDQLSFTNNTGSPANDLHIEITLMDTSAYIQSARMDGPGNIFGAFKNSGFGAQPKAVDWDFTNIDVPNGATFSALSTLDLNHENQRLVGWLWTRDGAVISPWTQYGHIIQLPIPAPQALTASASGWAHHVTLINDNDTSAVLRDFSLHPTMTHYADLSMVPWTLADQVVDSAGITIAPRSTFEYDLMTATPLIDGDVYFQYALAPTGTTESLRVIGVHPVAVVPEPAAGFLFLGGLIGLATRRSPFSVRTLA